MGIYSTDNRLVLHMGYWWLMLMQRNDKTVVSTIRSLHKVHCKSLKGRKRGISIVHLRLPMRRTLMQEFHAQDKFEEKRK